MNKRHILTALLLTCILGFSILAGCSKTPVNNGSSNITASEDDTQSQTTSEESKTQSNTSKKTSATNKNSSTNSKTESTESKTNSVGISDEDWILDEDDEQETSGTSSTQSSGIKQYKNPKNLGLIAYHCSSFWCNSAGAELADKVFGTPADARLKEFKQVVEAKYFNQYFLSLSKPTGNMDQLLVEAEIIAKAGGSFWIAISYDPSTETLRQYEQKLREVLEELEKHGYRDLVNGVHWDEPYYNNYSLQDLQDQMKVNYTVFGLRNFPVFGLAEFSDATPNTNKNGDPMPWVSPEYSKYITDAGFDYYSVDVRDGASNGNGGAYRQHSEYLGETVKTGKELYLGYTKRLKNLIGHPFSLWYFPSAFGTKTWDSPAADEDYSIAHLEFFAEELLKEEYPGGLALYTYHTHTQSHGYVGLQERIPLTNPDGSYAYYPKQEKWTRYFDMVQKYRIKFDAIRYKYVKIDV